MKWTTLSHENLGDFRIISKFLVFPKVLKGVGCWLERVYIVQYVRRIAGLGSEYKWEDEHFISRKRYLEYQRDEEEYINEMKTEENEERHKRGGLHL